MPKRVDEERIFTAAVEMLMSGGYGGATTKAIADEAGVNEVTLFRRYGSKAGLFEKAIGHRLADTPLNKIAFTGNLENDLHAIAEAYVETNESYGDIVAIILIELPRYPDLQELMSVPWNNIQGILTLIRTYQNQGKLRREPPLSTLGALVGPIMINMMFRRANLRVPVPAVDLRSHIETFLNGRRA